MGFVHAFHSDVKMRLVYSSNLRLKYGYFIRFQDKQFDLIARCRNWQNTLRVLEIIVYQYSQSLRFFVNVNLIFQTGAFYSVMS